MLRTLKSKYSVKHFAKKNMPRSFLTFPETYHIFSTVHAKYHRFSFTIKLKCTYMLYNDEIKLKKVSCLPVAITFFCLKLPCSFQFSGNKTPELIK